MSCHRYHVDIELLSSLNDGAPQFQPVFAHLKQCSHCLARYHTARQLDEVLETKLNELDPPDSFPTQVMSHIQYSLMPTLRKAVLEEIKSVSLHPTAQLIYQQVRPGFPQTSIRSIYRQLAILRDGGNILELDFGEGVKRFDGNLEPHCHFICQQCQAIHDICYSPHQLVDLSEIQNIGHEVLEPNLELRGICRECRVV